MAGVLARVEHLVGVALSSHMRIMGAVLIVSGRVPGITAGASALVFPASVLAMMVLSLVLV